MKRIIISENQLNYLRDNNGYSENNSSEIFNKEVRNFLYCLMKDEKDNISDYWGINGITKIELFKKLKRYGILNKTEDGGILVPKKNFDKRVDRVYYELFDNADPNMLISEDDGGSDSVSDGGTTTFSVGGSYEVPIAPIQRRKITNLMK